MTFPGGQDRRSLEARLRDALERIRRLEASSQNGTTSRRATRVQSAAIGNLDAHKAAANPHPQYLTEDEADALYEALGAVNAHEAEADPHEQYLLHTEGLDMETVFGGVAASYYLGLEADGGDSAPVLTGGIIDGGSA